MNRSARLGSAIERERRAEGRERGRQQQHDHGLQLDRPAGRRLHDQRAGREAVVAADDAAVLPVVVLVQRVEVRNDHRDRQHGPGQAPAEQQRAPADAAAAAGRGPEPAGPSARARTPSKTQQRADRGDREPLVLLDEHQRQRPQRGRPDPAADQRRQREREQRHRQRDLVEVEVDHLLQAPAEAVGEPDQPSARPSEQRRSGRHDREHRQRGQQRLEEQQGGGRGEQPEERRQHRQADLEVIAEQVEPGPPDVHDRRPQQRQLLDVLGVDAQVPGGGRELQEPEERDRVVGAEHQRRDRPRDRVPPDARLPVGPRPAGSRARRERPRCPRLAGGPPPAPPQLTAANLETT